MKSGNRFEAIALGVALAEIFLKNETALSLLGDRNNGVRAITYGDIEHPGDAAAAALKN